jgi:hypothetical protein
MGELTVDALQKRRGGGESILKGNVIKYIFVI